MQLNSYKIQSNLEWGSMASRQVKTAVCCSMFKHKFWNPCCCNQ